MTYTYHNERFLITITCVIYQPDGTNLVHRGLVFNVLKNVNKSALIYTLGKSVGDSWEVARHPELFMNGEFSRFENQIKELWEGPQINREATFELRYDKFTDQVSRKYMLEHGFGPTNVPWSGLAKQYIYGKPDTKRQWLEEFKFNVGKTGFSDKSYFETPNSYLDVKNSDFSPEELNDAERHADILRRYLKLGV